MNKDKYVFSQLVTFLDEFKFLRIVKKYEGNKYIKSYTCWNQLLTMMFGQLSNRESLRDLIVSLEAHTGKLYHLGIGKSVTRSNLSKANEQRDYRIFQEYATFMIAEARKRRIERIFELDGHVYALIPPRLTFVCQCSSGLNSASIKAESRCIRSTMWKRKFLHLCILLLLIFTIQKRCL